MAIEPFALEEFARLLESDSARTTLLRRRESKTLELKANFNLSDDAKVDYARTMAAFANRDGGYLLFGIRDKPHEMDGMQNKKLDELDPRIFSQFLQNHFSPNIDWEHRVHEVDGKRFGFIYVWPAKRKPIVCVAANSKGKTLRDGDVYYRYQGETKLIGSSELHALIDERVEQERRSWKDLLVRTAHLDPPSVAYLDLESGRLSGAEGSLIIGQDVLDKVKFIQEGNFADGGEPTLNVIGNVEVVSTVPIAVDRPVAKDPSETHPMLQKNLIQQISNRIGIGKLNSFDLLCVRRLYEVDNNPDWFYLSAVGNHSPQYSETYLEWLVEQYESNSSFFQDARKAYKESQK